MINLRALRKTYPNVTALDDVSLSIPAGEVFGVVGRSGAGKSTLLRTVNLLERPDSGTVEVDGHELTAQTPAQLRASRRRIGMIFQHFNLLSNRTVAGNVSLPLEISRTKRDVAELLDLVGLSDKANAYPHQLSGGQRQRVAIARALANDPAVLLSDEATSALDPHTTVEVLDLLRDLNRRLGLTILLITHDLGVVTRICDRVGVIENGRLDEVTRVDEPGPAFLALQRAVL